MTDLDIYFWRFFAIGAGFGIVYCSWGWLVTMGRAARFWFTMQDESRALFKQIYEMLGTIGVPPYHHRSPLPDWYCRYVAFREVGYLKP